MVGHYSRCGSQYMPSLRQSLLASGLEDCCLIVAQLLYALLDVRHGCVKSLHMKQPI